MPQKPPKYRPNVPRPPEGRPSPPQRGYGSDWQKAVRTHLRSHPLCQDCFDRGLVVRATEVGRVVGKKRGGTDDPGNLRARCPACHGRATGEHGGPAGDRPPAA